MRCFANPKLPTHNKTMQAIGGSMLGLGVFYYLQIVEIGTAVNDELAPLIIVLAVVGAVLFVTSMIGCCGLCAKQSYLLSGVSAKQWYLLSGISAIQNISFMG